ncbi:unnamed protein product, partial [Iphiclides podalirius]
MCHKCAEKVSDVKDVKEGESLPAALPIDILGAGVVEFCEPRTRQPFQAEAMLVCGQGEFLWSEQRVRRIIGRMGGATKRSRKLLRFRHRNSGNDLKGSFRSRPGPRSRTRQVVRAEPVKLTLTRAIELAEQAACAKQAMVMCNSEAIPVKEEPVYRVRNQGQPGRVSGARRANGGYAASSRCAVCGMENHQRAGVVEFCEPRTRQPFQAEAMLVCGQGEFLWSEQRVRRIIGRMGGATKRSRKLLRFRHRNSGNDLKGSFRSRPGPRSRTRQVVRAEPVKLTLTRAIELAEQAACAKQAMVMCNSEAIPVKEEPVYRVRNQGQPGRVSGARRANGGYAASSRCAVCGMENHQKVECGGLISTVTSNGGSARVRRAQTCVRRRHGTPPHPGPPPLARGSAYI